MPKGSVASRSRVASEAYWAFFHGYEAEHPTRPYAVPRTGARTPSESPLVRSHATLEVGAENLQTVLQLMSEQLRTRLADMSVALDVPALSMSNRLLRLENRRLSQVVRQLGHRIDRIEAQLVKATKDSPVPTLDPREWEVAERAIEAQQRMLGWEVGTTVYREHQRVVIDVSEEQADLVAETTPDFYVGLARTLGNEVVSAVTFEFTLD